MAEDNKQRTYRFLIKWFSKLAISIIILIILFNKIPVYSIIESLASISLGYFMLSVFFMYISFVFMALQMKLLLEPHAISFGIDDVLKINMITSFYNLVIPGYLAASAVRWYHLQKKNQKRAEVAATILFNRLLDTLMLIVMGLAFWILDFSTKKAIFDFWVILFVAVCFFFAYVLSFNQSFHKSIERLLQIKPIPELFERTLTKIIRSLGQYNKKTNLFHLRVFFICLCKHLIGGLSLYFIVKGLEISVSFISLCWIRSAVIILLLLPISFSGFGVREVSFIYFFGRYGIPSHASIAFSFLMFARSLFFSLPGGYFEFRERFLTNKRAL